MLDEALSCLLRFKFSSNRGSLEISSFFAWYILKAPNYRGILTLQLQRFLILSVKLWYDVRGYRTRHLPGVD